MVARLGGTLRGRRWLYQHRNQLLLSVATIVVAYLLCESVATLLALHGRLGQRAKSLIVYLETAGEDAFHFGSNSGIRLESTPLAFTPG